MAPDCRLHVSHRRYGLSKYLSHAERGLMTAIHSSNNSMTSASRRACEEQTIDWPPIARTFLHEL